MTRLAKRASSLTALGLLVALAAFLPERSEGQGIGPTVTVNCNKFAQASIASATTTSLVTAVAGQGIHVCGWHVTSTQSTSTTFQLEYGTTAGGPCGSPVTITPPFSVTSTAPSGDHNNTAYTSISSAAVAGGPQLCVVTTGATVGTAILVFYAQY